MIRLEPETIPIIADDRECRGGVVEALRATGCFDVTLRWLAVGDYKVDGRFLFERKTLPDLVLSIQSRAAVQPGPADRLGREGAEGVLRTWPVMR
ncbi:MAG: hypothetical protein HYU77_00830 [Betaproteobacteria bacterium]|nr:hypothetical protein [Betaproteobacteria bacterium]